MYAVSGILFGMTAIALIKWLHGYIDLCVPHLERETAQCSVMKIRTERGNGKGPIDCSISTEKLLYCLWRFEA